MNSVVIGIDLGTTFSAAAYVDERGVPQVIPIDDQMTLPSVVLIDGGKTVVGDLAMNQWVTNEEHVVRWIKRSMGDLDYRFQGKNAIEISAEILKTIKRAAELNLGQAALEAVITCPAYFNALEIENTKRAGELAGFHVREIIKEPTAAAVYFGVENMRDGQKVLVCDLGGGTYDATVLALERGVFRPLASMGDRKLGGHDWTVELMAIVAEQFAGKHGKDPRDDLVAGQMLYEACERAKRDLARSDCVSIPCPAHGIAEHVTVTRQQFEDRNEHRVGRMVVWSDEAVRKAGLKWSDIDTILLVGGSSRLRRMGEALAEAAGKAPVQVSKPDLAVALGAAILARGKVLARRSSGGLSEGPRGGLVEIEFERIIPRNMGTRVLRWKEGRHGIANAQIIPHGTKAPCDCSRDDFQVSYDRQESFDVPVVEFEGEDDQPEPIKNYRCRCLSGAARGDRVKVTFHYDVSGVITADAVDVKTGQRLPLEERPYEEPGTGSPGGRGSPGAPPVGRRWVVFALDVSSSMDGEKIHNAKTAVINSTRELLSAGPEGTQVGLVTFGSSAEVRCPPSADGAKFERAATKVQTWGTTAMDQGIVRAVDMLSPAPAGVERQIVLVTDGMPDDQARTLAAAQRARDRGASLLILGFEGEVDEAFLGKLSPHKLMIQGAAAIGEGLANLLSLSTGSGRGGLKD
jgi:molecular chaperone DnaK